MRLAALAALLLLGACKKTEPTAIERLKPCKMDDGPVDAYCGTLEVFENRETKQGRKVGLKIVVLPAMRRDPRPDPLFALAGGPGQGAAKAASLFAALMRRHQNDRDIVLVDQRGTGGSNLLDCKLGNEDTDDLNQQDDYPAEKFRDCLKSYNADPKFYTTPVAMDDLDDVRRHLGYGQINVWGGSYGTRAALVYLRQHPESVRSVILDGVAPTGMRLPLYFGRDGQRALDLLLTDCEKDGACSKRFPGLRDKVKRVLAAAEAKPKVTLTHPRTGIRQEMRVSRLLVSMVVMNSLYDPGVSSLLPKLLDDAANGNYQGLLALAFRMEGPGAPSISPGMFLSVVCAEDMPAIQPAEIKTLNEGTLIGTGMFGTRMKPCEFWPKGDIPASYRDPVKSDKPVLVLSGDLDPVTPPSWGEETAKHLSKSRHIVVPGAGHGVSALGCVPRLIQQFLADADASKLDPSCVQKQKRPPFFTTYSGPEAVGSAAPEAARQ